MDRFDGPVGDSSADLVARKADGGELVSSHQAVLVLSQPLERLDLFGHLTSQLAGCDSALAAPSVVPVVSARPFLRRSYLQNAGSGAASAVSMIVGGVASTT